MVLHIFFGFLERRASVFGTLARLLRREIVAIVAGMTK
jgi:hypothetical protein